MKLKRAKIISKVDIAKFQEEDITITNNLTKETFPVSLKAYGIGPIQLSTDKEFLMFPRIAKEETKVIDKQSTIKSILADPGFAPFHQINVLPLIYDEKLQKCNILVFDPVRAAQSISRIVLEDGSENNSKGKGRKHPVFRFNDKSGNYICEVRYGGASANALVSDVSAHKKSLDIIKKNIQSLNAVIPKGGKR